MQLIVIISVILFSLFQIHYHTKETMEK